MQRFVFLLILSSTVAPAHAEPSSALGYLTSQPVTVMDLGLLKTTFYLKETPLYYINTPQNRVAYYDETREKIVLKVLGSVQRDHPDTARAHCQSTLKTIQKLLGIEPDTGRRYFTGISGMGLLFWHWGQLEGRPPKDWMADLEHMTEVVVHIPVYHKKKAWNVTCRSALRGTDVVFGEVYRP